VVPTIGSSVGSGFWGVVLHCVLSTCIICTSIYRSLSENRRLCCWFCMRWSGQQSRPRKLRCVHRRVVPIQCVIGCRTCFGSLLGSHCVDHQLSAGCGSSQCLARASASYGGQHCGVDGGFVALHASVGTLRVGQGVDTLESARGPLCLDGTLGSYSRLRVGTYVVMLVTVASHG